MMRVLSFYAGGESFAADVSVVSKVARNLRLTPVPAAPDGVAGLAWLKGKVVTMLDLAVLCGAKAGPASPGETVNAVVFKGTSEALDPMGLIIEKPGELLEIDSADFTAGHCEIDGTLYSIIDINSIISRYKEGGRRNAAEQRRGMRNE